MDEINLPEGTTFGEIATATDPADASKATPEGQTPEANAATDGGKTEPEVPAAFKEQPSEEAAEKPDLSLDKDLEGHPVLKAKWEAFVAQKEKGIDKWMTEQSTKLKDAEQFKEDYQPLVDFYQEFDNPQTVDQAFEKMCLGLSKAYGKPFGGFSADGKPPVQPQKTEAGTNEDEIIEKESWGETKTRWKGEFLGDVKELMQGMIAELKGELEPVKKHFTSQAEREAQLSKATAAVPELKQQFEVASDPWVTPEKVQEAMTAYPGLAPDAAFRAHFAIEIGKYYARHSTNGQAVKNMPSRTSGAATRADLKTGATFLEITQAESNLG